MYLKITLGYDEFDTTEFSRDARFLTLKNGDVVAYEPIAKVEVDDGRASIEFLDGAVIVDPSWSTWGVVANFPAEAVPSGRLD